MEYEFRESDPDEEIVLVSMEAGKSGAHIEVDAWLEYPSGEFVPERWHFKLAQTNGAWLIYQWEVWYLFEPGEPEA